MTGPRLRGDREWTWTQCFAGVSALSLLFAAVQLNWFGLLRGTNEDLLVEAALLTLVGLFALRVSALGMAAGLAVAFIAIFVDQATAGIGIQPLRFAPPTAYWTLTLTRVCVTWMAFPLSIWALSRFTPRPLHGIVIGAALLPLPFIRHEPINWVVDVLVSPMPGRYVVLAVPWLHLCVFVALLASAALLLWQRRSQVMPALVAALTLVTVVLPVGAFVTHEFQAASAVRLVPTSGGPLTEVSLTMAFATPGSPIFAWDGERLIRNSNLAPIRTGMTTRAELTFLPATASNVEPGPHRLAGRAGDEERVTSFVIVPPGGLTVNIDADRGVLVTGPPNRPLRIYVDGEDGPQLLDVSLDGAGQWRSSLPLPAGPFSLIAQSGIAWRALESR